MVGGPTAAPLESPPRQSRSSALALAGAPHPSSGGLARHFGGQGEDPPANPPKEGILLATARPSNGSFPFSGIALRTNGDSSLVLPALRQWRSTSAAHLALTRPPPARVNGRSVRARARWLPRTSGREGALPPPLHPTLRRRSGAITAARRGPMWHCLPVGL